MSRIEPMNKKARAISASGRADVRGYTVEGCCPSFIPGWETDDGGGVDPCPWQADLSGCHGFLFICFWAGQVPDAGGHPNWLDACGNIQNDWTNLCVVPD